MEHLDGLEIVKANDSQYRYGIRNGLGDIVADVTGFTNGREIALLFAAAPVMFDALKAHAEWKRHTERCTACILDLSCPAYSALERKADDLTHDALALVRGEGEQ